LPEACTGITVNVSFSVGADGVPRNPTVISRGAAACHPFALRVVEGWSFRPALDADGRAVASAPVAAAIQF
jgi:outer membrane biosynthesis protein TonB